MKGFYWGIVSFFIVIDQVTKHLADTHLHFFQSKVIIPGLLNFQLVHNFGAAYGIFQQKRLFLLVVSFGVVAALMLYRKVIIESNWTAAAWIFLVSGALGNGIDRLLYGYVVDFIDIGIFPVFNFADMFIDAAVVCFLIDWIRSKRKHA